MAPKGLRRLSLTLLLFLTACTTTLSPGSHAPFLDTPDTPPAAATRTQTASVPQMSITPSSTAIFHENTETVPTFIWENTVTPAVLGLTKFAEGVNPLTGLRVADPEKLKRRPVMIKVSNYPRYGRPHAGLSYADLVFEYYIGEQMNRFLAVYYGQDSHQVGPLRSGRLIDLQLASMYGGILVYGGADPKVNTRILNVLHDRAFTHIYTACPPICGQDTHSVAGVFVDSEGISEYALEKEVDNTPPGLEGFLFDPNSPDGFEPASMIGVEYSFRNRGEWHYDTDSGQYLRWIEADDEYTMIPLVDRVNDKQIAFSNVVILFTTYIEYAPTLHDIVVWDNIDGGRAFVFRDGVVQEGIWKVSDHEQPIQLYNNYGLPIALKPGSSWFIFMGQQSAIQQENLAWEFFFDLP